MTKQEQKQKKRAEIGRRLKEVINREHLTYAALIDKANTIRNCSLYPSHISEIIRKDGKRNLTEYDADTISDALNIDRGYLRGDDRLIASSYEEYLAMYANGKYEHMTEEWKKYRYILGLINCRIDNSFITDSDVNSYVVRDDNTTATISADDMQSFYDDVCRYIRKRFDPIMELGKDSKIPALQISVEHGTITDEERQEGI